MKVHHLNCATLHMPGGRLVNGVGEVSSRAELVCHCLLVEAGAGLVLVDTGLGTADVRGRGWKHRRRLGLIGARPAAGETAVEQLARLGYAPDDVGHIVLTHLDYDHTGGLSDFPRAEVHVFAAEHDAATRPRTWMERSRYSPSTWDHRPRWVLHRTEGERWFDFDCVRQIRGLPPEVLLVPLAGHTRGHCAVAVETPAGWLLHAGDAYFFAGEVETPRPWCTPLLSAYQTLSCFDARVRLDNLTRLRDLRRRHGDEVRVFSAHDPDEFYRLARGND